MRIATYNIEWFTSLFDDHDRLRADGEWSARYNVTRAQQAEALAQVFRAMDADAVLIVEAPDANGKRSTVRALEGFAAHYGLRTTEAVLGFVNETQQEIALLFDPDRLQASHAPEPGHDDVPRFDGVFSGDPGRDGTRDQVVFSKPPLELAIRTEAGFEFRMIGVHLKSKAPHGAKSPADVKRLTVLNRRKQLAQATWLRARIDQHLGRGEALIVLGDLNDGPGLADGDELAARSSPEVVMGEDPATRLFDPHARQALLGRLTASPSTSRFWLRPEKRYLEALLDYIMVSADILSRGARWRIWHPLDDPKCWEDSVLREALVTASDHFPVTLDVEI